MAGARPETVTVLFTDVVGSTAWRAQVGALAADDRVVELELASREVVAASGGTVVKSLVDGVMATFTAASAALDAASALQAVARRLAVGGLQECLRVGISSGDMRRAGKDWIGTAAIEASRICAEAAGGAVLISEATAVLSRDQTQHVLRHVGGRTLRGFSVPVDL